MEIKLVYHYLPFLNVSLDFWLTGFRPLGRHQLPTIMAAILQSILEVARFPKFWKFGNFQK